MESKDIDKLKKLKDKMKDSEKISRAIDDRLKKIEDGKTVTK
tara:strand:+ start:3706 stop:3831 length:126 start_codon:yes stop_codon:yes gene_type:complete